MSDKCTALARFTTPGTLYDRWYCPACGAVLFLPHGDPAPEEHLKGELVIPVDPKGLPEPPLPTMAQLVATTFPQDPNTVRDARALSYKAPLPIEIHTRNLPSDVLIVEKEK